MKNKNTKYKVGNRIFKTYSTAIEYAIKNNLSISIIS